MYPYWEKWSMMFIWAFCKWAHALIYLDSLDACTDDLSVVVLGAEWTCILALPQKVEGTAITRPLWTVTVEEYKLDHKDEIILNYSSNLICLKETKGWVWSRWQIPRQCYEVFGRHCRVTSQSDGGWSAFFTCQRRLRGPGNNHQNGKHKCMIMHDKGSIYHLLVPTCF